jgi:segregation and condensation protein B
MEIKKLKNILEAVLLAADRSLTVIQLEALFELDEERPTRDEVRQALHEMAQDYESRGYELKEVASGYRLQVRQDYATWVGRLWEEKPARYTRALLETMALIAYRQPITRGEIEEVRGVSVSSNIIKTLLERDWIKVLGHKDVPGKPSLYGTTREFLDYFNLKSLDQLPTLAEIRDLDSIHPELALDEMAGQETDDNNPADDDEKDADSGDDATSASSTAEATETVSEDDAESEAEDASESTVIDSAETGATEVDTAEADTHEELAEDEALLEDDELSDESATVKSASNV